MAVKESIFHWVGRVMFERPAGKRSVVEHAAELSKSGDEVRARIARKSGTPKNVARLRHVVGIERWGQARLRVFLGDPLVMDGHHGYKPTSTDWDTLQAEFASARADTVALAARLTTTDLPRTVPHNQFGPLTERGWLQYIRGHAQTESKLMR
jgi:hypothetical protein